MTWSANTSRSMSATILHRGRHGEQGDLFRQAAGVSAGGPAARDLPDLLLLAGGAGGVAILPGAGCLRPVDPVRLVRELRRPLADARILPGDRRHLRVFGAGRGVFAGDRALTR